MLHVSFIKDRAIGGLDAFVERATGRFYTHEFVGRRLARRLVDYFASTKPIPSKVRVVDPFAGDARLILWLIEAWVDAGLPRILWDIEAWDLDDHGLQAGRERLAAIACENLDLDIEFHVRDAFEEVRKNEYSFDFVVSNPPWENLKPDRRELRNFGPSDRLHYLDAMKEYDAWLAKEFPRSQPRRKFAGWGTNLSRAGLEACLRLCRPRGLVGIVLPASFLADDQSVELRRHLLTEHSLRDIAYFPAEARLFSGADVATATLVVQTQSINDEAALLDTYRSDLTLCRQARIQVDPNNLEADGFVLPVAFGGDALAVLNKIRQRFGRWSDLEADCKDGLWAGRELDETGSANWLSAAGGGPLFIKGRMIDRYAVCERPSLRVSAPTLLPSMGFRRIAWRDVSRPNQKRRVIATLIEAGWVAGNSLGVAYFRDGDERALLGLLGIMNSTCFELQLRMHLATGHVSLSSLRKVRVPSRSEIGRHAKLISLVRAALCGSADAAARADAYVAALIYEMTREDYAGLLSQFVKMTEPERATLLRFFDEELPLEQMGKSGD